MSGRIGRMISGAEIVIKAQFAGRKIDQVFTKNGGWEDCNDVIDGGLIATLRFFNHGDDSIAVHIVRDDISLKQPAGDYRLSEITT